MLASAGTIGKTTERPYSLVSTASGDETLIDCDSVGAIARYMMHEDNRNMTKADMDLFSDWVKYSDGEIPARHDIIALDQMLVVMVQSGQPCSVIKGGNSA